jgi:hypothetical protein
MVIYAVVKDGVLVGKFANSVFASAVAAHAGALLAKWGPAPGGLDEWLLWEPVSFCPVGAEMFRAYAPEGYFQ